MSLVLTAVTITPRRETTSTLVPARLRMAESSNLLFFTAGVPALCTLLSECSAVAAGPAVAVLAIRSTGVVSDAASRSSTVLPSTTCTK